MEATLLIILQTSLQRVEQNVTNSLPFTLRIAYRLRYEQLTVYCVAHFSLFYTMALWTNEYVPSSVSSIRLELNLKQTFIVLDMRPKIGRFPFGEYFFFS